MVALQTTPTEFLAVAEPVANKLQYIRVARDKTRTLSLDAQSPRRGLLMGPGNALDTYWVSSHVWTESDLAKGCADLMAIHDELQRHYPAAEFDMDVDNCMKLHKQLPRSLTIHSRATKMHAFLAPQFNR
jgi:hypothetical protein